MVQNDYDTFRKIDPAAVTRCHIRLEKNGDLRATVWLKAKSGLPFQFSSRHLVADFHAVEMLKDLRARYYCSRKSLWRLLDQLGLDPWERAIKDYKSDIPLAQVAKRHGLKKTTLSNGLKHREVPIRIGRPPIQFDSIEVQKALQDCPSVKELSRRLGSSWDKAKEQWKSFEG
ncbi:hypothetical protein [Ruegeria meonggei]|uniref:Uncharacterized protein n=1 Tax=Ruegeria meonggei TaxID=1446476 RepID=A0A1X6ZN05_9RHOB|nr:hypothetical protein [Ruegeria meonggei]SLN56053.1 hypothetical protein RUM8411_02734 [Ruegeria meonggei]